MQLQPDERIDQLYANDIQIIQSASVFSFSMDAVLLANFPKLPKRGKIVDMCAGNGAVALFMSRQTNAQIELIELQPRLADMAQRSVALNQLTDQLTVHQTDLKLSKQFIKPDSVDLLVCNPPYFAHEPNSQKNPNEHLALARHEIATNLTEVVQTASQLLKMNGRFAMVHRPDRFLNILDALRQHRLAPKRVRFVYPKPGKPANILLIEAIKDGKESGFQVEKPLFIHDENGGYSPEMARYIYGS